MGNEKKKAITFEKLSKKAFKAESLEKLFRLWQEAHKLEADELIGTGYIDSVTHSATKKSSDETTLSQKLLEFSARSKQEKEPNTSFYDIVSNSFNIDGITDYPYFCAQQGYKTIFLLKEENNSSSCFYDFAKNKSNDLGEYTINKFPVNPYFQYIAMGKSLDRSKIGCCNYYRGITDETNKDNYEIFKSCGYMNINKRGGAKSTNDNYLFNYFKKYFLFILRELQLLSSADDKSNGINVFICGLPKTFTRIFWLFDEMIKSLDNCSLISYSLEPNSKTDQSYLDGQVVYFELHEYSEEVEKKYRFYCLQHPTSYNKDKNKYQKIANDNFHCKNGKVFYVK